MRAGAPPWAAPRIAITSDGSRLASRQLDVVVVGAGITGACVAHGLVGDGRRVVMLDRAAPVRGSTMASTALITFELDLPMHVLARSIGEEAAAAAWHHSVDALDALRELVLRERIACDWTSRDSLYLAGSAHGHRALRTEAAMRRTHGLPGEFVPANQLRERYGIDRTGALHADGVAAADPVRLTSGILAATRELEIHSPVEVTTVRSAAGGVELETNRGTIRAATAVFCTGYALLDCLPRAGLAVESTWAITGAPGLVYPTWLATTMVWEASNPYLYLRSGPSGGLIVGGRDEHGAERHAEPKLMEQKARAIAADAGRLLGLGLLKVERAWAGAFGSSDSGLPVIGPVPGIPGCHVVAGFGGNGITHAMLASRLITAELRGEPLDHSPLYHPVNAPGEIDTVAG